MERQIRTTKRKLSVIKDSMNMTAELDVRDVLKENYDKTAFKLKQQLDLYEQFCKEAKLQPQAERTKLAKFSQREANNAIKAAKNVENVQKHGKINPKGDAVIPEAKFTKYALNMEKAPDKAIAYQKALGYDLGNYQELIDKIQSGFDTNKLNFKRNNGFGDLYEQYMQIDGPNGKTATVCTGWIRRNGENYYSLASAYIKDRRM